MASARYAWGIDIGNRALKAIRLSRVGEGYRLDDFDVIEHEQILSQAGDNRDSFIQASLNTFVQRHSLKSSVVSIGVSGQASFARFIKLPPVEKKQITNIVRFEAIQQIPFPLDDVEWSYQLFETPDSPDVEVGIFAMRKELVAQHIKFFTDLDMKVAAVQMNPLAVYNALQHDARLGETTMIIDMGAENTDLIIADNNSVWLRSIPIGGNSFTEALVKSFKLNFAKAEELKRTAGTSKYTRQIFQAMRPIFSDLVSEIQRSMGFFSSVRRDTRVKRIIALGGTFRLPNLLRYLQQNLQLEIDRLDALRAGAPSDAKLTATFNDNMLSLVGAYGLALQAMGEGKIQSSLLPAAIRRERMWKEKTKWFGAAAGLMVAGTGIVYASVYLARAGEKSTTATVNDGILSHADKLIHDWSAVESAGSAERDSIAGIFKLMDFRNLWSNIITDLRGALPVPQPEVAEGMAKWDAKKVKLVPRDQRRLVLMQDLNTEYLPNVLPQIAAFDARPEAGPIAAPPEGTQGGNPVRGFRITMRCITPHRNATDFFVSEYISRLLKVYNNRPGTTKYVVARAKMLSCQPLDANILGQVQATFTQLRPGIPTGPVAPTPTPAPGQTGVPAGLKVLDPLTEEDVSGDQVANISVLIALDPPEDMIPKPAATQPAAIPGTAAPTK